MTHTFRFDEHTAVVRTTKGLVQGYAQDDLLIFKGIPYATAKRFHAPQPMEAWKDVFQATSYGYVCPLLNNDRPKGELYVPHRFWPMDEDCMNLNVWTPGCTGEKRPVLVWLHGGGYEAGSSIEHIAYDGANMSRYGNAVVVSINHRLNILGYFDLSDFGEEYANSGNAGGDDIIAALQWVRENIEAFGGDPDNVTVFGQSGGGGKITTLLQSPGADGLFHKGIIMSGVIGPVLADAEGSGRELAEAVMKELGISTVKELEKVDHSLFAKAYKKVRPALEKAGKYVGGRPHPNQYYLGEPCIHGFRRETANIPLLIGSVFGEFTSFSASPFDRDQMTEEAQCAAVAEMVGSREAEELIALFKTAYPERAIVDLLRLDFIFRNPEMDYIARRSRLNRCTWSYMFNMDQPIGGGSTPWHCCDVPYVFRNIDLVEYPHGPQKDPKLSEKIQDQAFESVMAFARTGDPNNSCIPAWPASTEGREATLLLDEQTRVLENYDHALIPAAARIMGPVLARQMQKIRENAQH